MTTFRCSVALAAVALIACAPTHPGSLTAKPGRSHNDMVAEIRIHHNDILDAIRAGDPDRISRQITPLAVLILPPHDTIRGAPAIALQVAKLFKTYPIEAVRATAAARTVQCTDGMLERTGDWSLQVVKPDKSRTSCATRSGCAGPPWGTSLRISMISFTAVRGGLSEGDAHCTNVDTGG